MTDKQSAILFQRISSDAKLPTKGSELAAGWDLYSPINTIVPARGKAMIPIGWAFRVPTGTYGRIAPRSGLSWKYSIQTGAGVIDEDFRSEVGVILFNHSDQDMNIFKGDRIAQLILEKIQQQAELIEVDKLPDSNRNGGFGSTGK